MFQRKWYRNVLMKGFHIVVLLAAGPGIRDTQVIFCFLNAVSESVGSPSIIYYLI